MKELAKVLAIILIALAISIGVVYTLGWAEVLRTETVGKAQQNANRTVYEETSSFTKGKRQEIIKTYKEWSETESIEEKKAIESILSMSLADFDEDKFITDPKLLSWVKEVKY